MCIVTVLPVLYFVEGERDNLGGIFQCSVCIICFSMHCDDFGIIVLLFQKVSHATAILRGRYYPVE